MQNHDYIHFMLENISDYFNADRVVVANIHSYSFVDYKAYDKVFSVLYEHCTDTTFSIKEIVKNIPISTLELELDYYKDDILIVSFSDLLNDKCKAHLKNINSNGLLNCLIRFNKLIVGILSLQFSEGCPYSNVNSIPNKEKSRLLSYCRYLSAII